MRSTLRRDAFLIRVNRKKNVVGGGPPPAASFEVERSADSVSLYGAYRCSTAFTASKHCDVKHRQRATVRGRQNLLFCSNRIGFCIQSNCIGAIAAPVKNRSERCREQNL